VVNFNSAVIIKHFSKFEYSTYNEGK